MQDKIKEVEQIRQQLQDFVYVVSHDLNGPIRHIREFSKLLISNIQEQHGPRALTEDELLFSQIIQDSVKKMEDRIDGLLRYSSRST